MKDDPVLTAFDGFADTVEAQLTRMTTELRTLQQDLGTLRAENGLLRAELQQRSTPDAQGLSAELREAIEGVVDRRAQEALASAMRTWYRGVYKPGEPYAPGLVVTWDGNAWVSARETSTKPGTDDSWNLFCKRGRDGRDRR